MNIPHEKDPAALAKDQLARACQTLDTSARLVWTMTICQIILLVILGLALVDYWLMMSVPLRTAGALALAAMALAGIFRLVRFYCRPTRLKQGALEIEAQKPQLGCEISTAAEYLSGERKIQHDYEPELVAALETKAARDLAAAPLSLREKFVRRAALLGITFVVLLLIALLLPGALTAFQRAAVPFSKAHYTAVEVQPGEADIPVGKDLAFTNIFSGRLPKDARLHWRGDSALAWQTVPLSGGSDGVYVHTLTNLQSDFVYRVTGSDAASPEYKVTTYVPPEVKEFNVTICYPAYTRRDPSTQDSPDISAVRASTAQIRIQPSVALSKARLRFAALPEIQLTNGVDGWWEGNLVLTTNTDYWIELADQKGHPGVNEKPYHLNALPDNPPKVEITEPGRDIRSSATNKVLVKISVSDDFGVGEIKLLFNKLGGAQKELPVTTVILTNGEATATAELDLAPLELNDYELVAYHAEATDNNTLDGPGIGRSPVYFVEITNEEGSKSLAQRQGQKVNLLVIQKQIIADTTALASNAQKDKFDELAARQKDVADFGHMYLDGLSAAGAADAQTEMQAAVKDMESAQASLEKQSRPGALPPEESALAHLYQVLKKMPELKDLPTQPQTADEKPPPDPKLAIVLEAIKQKKKERPDNQELERALEQAQDLARSQAGVNTAMRHPEEGNAAQRGTAGQNPAQNAANAPQDQNHSSDGKDQQNQQQTAQNQQAQAAGKNQGEGKQGGQNQEQAENAKQDQQNQQNDQNTAEAKSAQQNQQAQNNGKGQGQNGAKGEGQPQEQKQPADDSTQQPQKRGEMAAKEEQLSKEAAMLAEMLKRLAGKDARLGHNAGRNANRAAAQMKAAGEALAEGRFGAAGEYGFQGELALRNVVDQLERLIKNEPEASDIANEEAPKEYETLISEYLKKLSHAE